MGHYTRQGHPVTCDNCGIKTYDPIKKYVSFYKGSYPIETRNTTMKGHRDAANLNVNGVVALFCPPCGEAEMRKFWGKEYKGANTLKAV